MLLPRLYRNVGSRCRSLFDLHKPSLTVLSRNIVVHEPKKRTGDRKVKSDKPYLEQLRDGVKTLKPESMKLARQYWDIWHLDHHWVHMQHGDYEPVFEFHTKEQVDSWTVSTDYTNNKGKSSASLALSRENTAIFSGYVNTEVPDDGKQMYAGYAAMASPFKMKPFFRITTYDWSDFTHLWIKYRGDGRNYNVCLSLDMFFDINWNDQYNYPLYTRGGPYWQFAKIPFSKFFLAAYGRIQDKQSSIAPALDNVRYMAFTMGDGNLGPFQLEIDSIGILRDESHKEDFHYEMYENKPAQVY